MTGCQRRSVSLSSTKLPLCDGRGPRIDVYSWEGCDGHKVSDFHQTAINGAKFTQKKENGTRTRETSSN
jgi:hypothetical protein